MRRILVKETAPRRFVEVQHDTNRPITPYSKLEEHLSAVEQQLGVLKGSGQEALTLLGHCDAAVVLFQQLGSQDASLAAITARWQTIQEILQQKKELFLAEVGPRQLRSQRAKLQPPPERWWWYIDDLVAAEKRRRRRKILTILSLVFLALGALIYASWRYQANLDPKVVARQQHEDAAQSAWENGNWAQAKAELDTVGTLAPGDPLVKLQRGVLSDRLGDHQEAEQLYRQAAVAMDPEEFLWQRGLFYLQTGQIKAAQKDAKTALQRDEQSAESHFLAGQVYEAVGDYVQADREYDRCSQLADAQGKTRLMALARIRRAYMLQYHPPISPKTPVPKTTP